MISMDKITVICVNNRNTTELKRSEGLFEWRRIDSFSSYACLGRRVSIRIRFRSLLCGYNEALFCSSSRKIHGARGT
jgi:hypothetical protein